MGLGFALAGIGLVGCGDPNDQLVTTNPNGGKKSAEYNPTAAAGVGKDMSKSVQANTTNLLAMISKTDRFNHRKNPFALNAEEVAFDRAQAAEKMLIDGGQFGTLYELEESKLPGEGQQPPEPQPYRRLSGILIGDSILAILEEGNRNTIIRPGMLIPETNWRVVSIDRDKAVLRREGSTRMPREVEVRLELGFPGSGGGGGFPSGGSGNPGGPGLMPDGGSGRPD